MPIKMLTMRNQYKKVMTVYNTMTDTLTIIY